MALISATFHIKVKAVGKFEEQEAKELSSFLAS
jgi:hypothetical protein